MVTLVCGIVGVAGNVVVVDTNESQWVDHLKQAIKEEISPTSTWDADALKLFLAKKDGAWLTENEFIGGGDDTSDMQQLDNPTATLVKVGLSEETIRALVEETVHVLVEVPNPEKSKWFNRWAGLVQRWLVLGLFAWFFGDPRDEEGYVGGDTRSRFVSWVRPLVIILACCETVMEIAVWVLEDLIDEAETGVSNCLPRAWRRFQRCFSSAAAQQEPNEQTPLSMPEPRGEIVQPQRPTSRSDTTTEETATAK